MFKFIWSYLKNYKRESSVIIICSVLTAVVDLSAPYLTGKFIDKIFVSADYELFYKFILLLLSISVLTILAQWLSFILSAKMRTNIINQLIEDMTHIVHDLRGEFIFKTDMIYLSKRIEADSNGIVYFATDNLKRFFIYFAMVVIAIFLLLSIGLKWLLIFFFVAIMHNIAYRYLEKLYLNVLLPCVRQPQDILQTSAIIFCMLIRLFQFRKAKNLERLQSTF